MESLVGSTVQRSLTYTRLIVDVMVGLLSEMEHANSSLQETLLERKGGGVSVVIRKVADATIVRTLREGA